MTGEGAVSYNPTEDFVLAGGSIHTRLRARPTSTQVPSKLSFLTVNQDFARAYSDLPLRYVRANPMPH